MNLIRQRNVMAVVVLWFPCINKAGGR